MVTTRGAGARACSNLLTWESPQWPDTLKNSSLNFSKPMNVFLMFGLPTYFNLKNLNYGHVAWIKSLIHRN